MLEILRDFLNKEIHKQKYENYNKLILELKEKEKEFTEKINELLEDIE